MVLCTAVVLLLSILPIFLYVFSSGAAYFVILHCANRTCFLCPLRQLASTAMNTRIDKLLAEGGL